MEKNRFIQTLISQDLPMWEEQLLAARSVIDEINNRAYNAKLLIQQAMQTVYREEVRQLEKHLFTTRPDDFVNCLGYALWYCGLQYGPVDNMFDFHALGSILSIVNVVETPGKDANIPTIVTILDTTGHVDHMGIISPQDPTQLIQRDGNGPRSLVPTQNVSLTTFLRDYEEFPGIGAIVYLQPKSELMLVNRQLSNRRGATSTILE